MPGTPLRALHDTWMQSLAATPKREVARSLPALGPLDVDSFERRILGAERRLVRVGTASGRPVAAPDSGQLVLLSCRNIDSHLVAVATLWKRGFVPLLADADLSRAEIAEIVRIFRPAFGLLDRRADPEGGSTEDLGDSLAGLHAWVPGGPIPRGARPRISGIRSPVSTPGCRARGAGRSTPTGAFQASRRARPGRSRSSG